MRTIYKGDYVNVYFIHAIPLFRVKITHRPIDTGDSWYVEHENGEVSSFMLYERMDRLDKEGEE